MLTLVELFTSTKGNINTPFSLLPIFSFLLVTKLTSNFTYPPSKNLKHFQETLHKHKDTLQQTLHQLDCHLAMDDEWDRERHDRYNRIKEEQRQRIYERQNEERVRERHDRQNRIMAEQRQRHYEQQDRQREEWRKKEHERIHGEPFNDDKPKTWAEIADEHERDWRRKDTDRMIDSLRVGSEQWYKEQEEERQRARHWSFD